MVNFKRNEPPNECFILNNDMLTVMVLVGTVSVSFVEMN